MTGQSREGEAFDAIVREAWIAAGGDGAAPTNGESFGRRLEAQMESVLEDSFFEEMHSTRDRLMAAADQIAASAAAHADELRPGEAEELSHMNKSTAMLAMRFSAAIMLDSFEGRVRRIGEPPPT